MPVQDDSKEYAIEVSVRPVYIEEQSDPAENRFVFAYFIKIQNTGTIAAKLISRHWIITDANMKVEEVKGLGVVGEQPHLEPGQVFEYNSGCMLETDVGTMEGSYQMVAADGHTFDARIPMFTLSIPRTLH
ncbi:Co2+/Mg2+ efflux protein ApaG [Leeia oryzae]|uniref:Co2+/Mg2+ efflux protein ApaG n=1 Tax=Leeia oryzae TaxID=356662 RepID=UPI0003770445|nr:Co2+/Mg2+ efflux protein ApaG [Leeia oryzae]